MTDNVLTRPYRTLIALHGWYTETYADGRECQAYCDPDDSELEGWNVHLQHRDPETDDLIDPEGADDFDEDFTSYRTARDAAERLLGQGRGVEIREY